MHKKSSVRLSDEERRQVPALTSQGNAAAYKSTQAHILLQADADGPAWTAAQIAERFALSGNTVLGVRQRLGEQGLEAARTRKKPERPARSPRLDGAGEARLIALRGSAPPAGQARWTLRLLAAPAVALELVEAISPETVRQALQKTR